MTRKRTSYYVQCRLVRPLSPKSLDSHQVLETWLPESKAIVGKWLELKIRGKWVNGWQVTETWSRRPAEQVEDKARDYLHQREASDA
jgi:hypothetical protein